MSTTALNIIQDALTQIGVYAQGETISAGDSSFALTRLNEMLDTWDAESLLSCFTMTFQETAMSTNTNPQTIGVSGSGAHIIVAGNNRPIDIPSAQIGLNTVSPEVYLPMRQRDRDWWAQNQVPGISTSIPTDYYYEPAFPVGNIFLWPVPTTAYGLRLQIKATLSQFASLATAFTGPPGYQTAIMMSLAEFLISSFGAVDQVTAQLTISGAARSRAKVITPNSKSLKIATADLGSQGHNRIPDFNYYSGMPV